jgi:hypothetical protein
MKIHTSFLAVFLPIGSDLLQRATVQCVEAALVSTVVEYGSAGLMRLSKWMRASRKLVMSSLICGMETIKNKCCDFFLSHYMWCGWPILSAEISVTERISAGKNFRRGHCECARYRCRLNQHKNPRYRAKAFRKFPSGITLIAKQMMEEVKKLAGDWKYDAVSIGYPGPVVSQARVLAFVCKTPLSGALYSSESSR